MRATFMPSSMRLPMNAGSREAGPRVQTIFARRIVGARSISFFEGLPAPDSIQVGPDEEIRCLYLLLAAAPWAGAGCTIQQPVPNLAGQDVHLTVVHTADLHSRFFPYYFAPGQIDKGLGLIPKTGQSIAVVGGIAPRRDGGQVHPRHLHRSALRHSSSRSSARRRRARSTSTRATSSRARRSSTCSTARSRCAPCREIGLTAMALGNHEFDKGSVNLEEQYQKFGGFPILAANYEFADPSDPHAAQARATSSTPATIVNVGGVKHRRHRHGQPVVDPGHHRGRQLARRAPDRVDAGDHRRGAA